MSLYGLPDGRRVYLAWRDLLPPGHEVHPVAYRARLALLRAGQAVQDQVGETPDTALVIALLVLCSRSERSLVRRPPLPSASEVRRCSSDG